MDHKISIVLNKSDTFKSANDLARTYGTLCWNLSKIISFKDMPMIYTSYLPKYEALPTLQNSISDVQRKVRNFYTFSFLSLRYLTLFY